MRQRANKLTRNVDVAIREVANSVVTEVVDATPVDTGKARSNWLASIGTPISGTITPHAPGSRLGRGETANRDTAIRIARAVIARRRTEQTLVIQNNVHYIRLLNMGSSRQAGRMFVQTAILRGIQLLNGRVFLK